MLEKPTLLRLHPKLCSYQGICFLYNKQSLKLMTYFISFTILAFHCLDYCTLLHFCASCFYRVSPLYHIEQETELWQILSKHPCSIISITKLFKDSFSFYYFSFSPQDSAFKTLFPLWRKMVSYMHLQTAMWNGCFRFLFIWSLWYLIPFAIPSLELDILGSILSSFSSYLANPHSHF